MSSATCWPSRRRLSERDGFGFVAFSHFCLTRIGDVTAGGTQDAEAPEQNETLHPQRLMFTDCPQMLAVV